MVISHSGHYEQLLEVDGSALVQGERIPIQGMGKLDHNRNRWWTGQLISQR